MEGQRAGQQEGCRCVSALRWLVDHSRGIRQERAHAPRSSIAPGAALLDQIRQLGNGSPWVFPSPDRKSHRTAIHKAHERIRKRAGVSFVPHDLRRTTASYMTSMGIRRLVVSKLLNHIETGITAVYDRHNYDQEKRAALDALGDRLEQIVKTRNSHSDAAAA
jgi:integrase